MDSSGNASTARRSSFSQTCNRLSQYVKENGGFGDRTMNLLPKIEDAGRDAAAGEGGMINRFCTRSVESGQMTIFYAGRVMVFDDFPADKVKEIMAIAGRKPGAAVDLPSPAESATAGARCRHPQLVLTTHDLPIARKNSLARFLEKRKDRIAGSAPYQPAKEEAWLGLAPR